MTLNALVNDKQEKDESFRAYVERFEKEAKQIRNLNLEVAMHHMIIVLQLGPFADSLCMQPTENLDELK